MSYKQEYAIRYTLTGIQQQIEVAVVTAATAIINEDPTTPDHVNRLNWANFAIQLSSSATDFFKWPIAQNATIQASVAADPTGNSVADNDVQFVVNSEVTAAVAAYKTSPYYKPPPTA